MMLDQRVRKATLKCVLCAAAAMVLAAAMLSSAQAQIVLYVTGQPITAYDIEQRSKLTALGGKPRTRQEIIQDLIDDKLKIGAAKRFNFEMSQAEIDTSYAGMARNAGMSADQISNMRDARGMDHKIGKACCKDNMSRIL
jgi:peptidyl-prolyl cis-trans isomerase SurA